MAEPRDTRGRRAAESRARRALRADAATRALADAPFVRIAGGLSNHAWRVGRGVDACFVRLGRAERLPGADLGNECRVLEATARAGLSPRVVRCDPGRRLLVTRWVAGSAHRRPPLPAAAVAAVGRALAALHRLRVPAGVRVLDFATQARELEALVGAQGPASLQSQAGAAFSRLHATARETVLCHNDLNALNLLWDREGRLWLVDWEYAGRGDAALDLASFASQHGLESRARAGLLHAYRAAGGTVDAGRLALARWAFDYVQWLWYRAALVRPGAGIAARVARARSGTLETALRRRASRVLRCNNATFGD